MQPFSWIPQQPDGTKELVVVVVVSEVGLTLVLQLGKVSFTVSHWDAHLYPR